MKILALDVSSTALGAAVLECEGTRPEVSSFDLYRPPAAWPAIRRIEAIAVRAVWFVEVHGRPAAEVVMEWQGPYRHARLRNADGLAVLGQAQGAVWAELRRIAEVHLVGEREWTVRFGRQATKMTRAAEARILCPDYADQVRRGEGMYDPGLDVADAIGLAFWFHTTRANARPTAAFAPGRIPAAAPGNLTFRALRTRLRGSQAP